MSINIMIIDGDPSIITQIHYDEKNEARYYENDDNKDILNPAVKKVTTSLNKLLREILPSECRCGIKNGRKVEYSENEHHYKKISISGNDIEKYEGRIWKIIYMYISQISEIIEPSNDILIENKTHDLNDNNIIEKHIVDFMRGNNGKKISREFIIVCNDNHLRAGGNWSSTGICKTKEIEHDSIIGRLSKIDFIGGIFTIKSNKMQYTINFKANHCNDINKLVNGCGKTLFEINVYGVIINKVDPIQLHFTSLKELSLT